MIENNSIENIWKKTVKAKIFKREKSRISCLLFITAGDIKLTPLIVFKGKLNGKIYNRLKYNNYALKNKIYIECQDNAWVTEGIFH